MVETEPLIRWPAPFVQYAGFAASFLASGAVGFRYAVLGRRRGVSAVQRSGLPSERRGNLAAGLVNAFSPLALASAVVLAIFGVITAWRHLKVLAAL